MTEALRLLANHSKLLREQAEETLDHDHPSEVEPKEDVWSGGENIELPIDIANVIHGADEQVTEPEVMEITELRDIIQDVISEQVQGMPMETMIEELIDVGWLEGDIHILEQLYDYIEDNGILDMNDISLGSAGPMPGEAYEMQYHGPVTIEEYMGPDLWNAGVRGHPEDFTIDHDEDLY
jgi:hypothetical protein